jgi:glutamate--cysteine ligase
MAQYNAVGSHTILTKWNEETVEQLCEYILPAQGETSQQLIGDETEFFIINKSDLTPVDYKTHQKVMSIIARDNPDYKPVYETDHTSGKHIQTALTGTGPYAGNTICGEPGCQIEWSSAPYPNLHVLAREKNKFINQLVRAAEEVECYAGLPGLYPLTRGANIPLSGRPRYHALQTRINAVKSGRGHDLSRGTCSFQINLDTSRDTWRKVAQGSLGIQPFIIALFANSPFFDKDIVIDPETSRPHVSERAVMWFTEWGDISRAVRSQILSPEFSSHSYVRFAASQELPILARPAEQGGDIELPPMTSFKDLFDKSKLPTELRNQIGEITAGDFVNALGTCYAPIKIKNKGIIELRGADASREHVLSLGALAAGLFYDPINIDQVSALISSLSPNDHENLAHAAPRSGLDTYITLESGQKLGIRETAQQLCLWAIEGLKRRGYNEEAYARDVLLYARKNILTPAESTIEDSLAGKSCYDIFRRSLFPVPDTALGNLSPQHKSKLLSNYPRRGDGLLYSFHEYPTP